MNTQYIVCAAIRAKEGDIIIGIRHFDTYMAKQIAEGPPRNWHQATQGFIDQHGTFLDRHEAWHVAFSNGQIRRRVGGDTHNGGTLFSENLY